MVKSQLLDGSASGIGNRKAQSQMQLHDTHLFQTGPIKSVVGAALIVEKSRFSPVNRRFGGNGEERCEIDDFGILSLAGLPISPF
jgi:hypothetical protein